MQPPKELRTFLEKDLHRTASPVTSRVSLAQGVTTEYNTVQKLKLEMRRLCTVQYNLDVSDGFVSESSLYRHKVVDSLDFWRIYRNPLYIVVRNKILGNLYVI